MKFALFGDHPDGLDMTRALVESGRHQLGVYSGPTSGQQSLERWDITCPATGDVESALADPAVDAVIIAGRAGQRFPPLRRALQSEKHVLCVHPLDATPDIAYEAELLQKELGLVVLPLLPELTHPAWERLRKLIAQDRAADESPGPWSTRPRLLQMERWATEHLLYDADVVGHAPGFPGWDILRFIAGEIIEVTAFAQDIEIGPNEPLLMAGLFEKGGLFQSTLLPGQPEARWRITVYLDNDRADLEFRDGWPGCGQLTWREEAGEVQTEQWDVWNPWQYLVEVFEQAVTMGNTPYLVQPASPAPADTIGVPTWHDEIRCLELDDAARRSIERRRSSTLEYQETVEEASFKGTMTLAGCGLLWLSLVLLILSIWFPYLGWFILPMCGVFLVFQVFRWVVYPAEPSTPSTDGEEPAKPN